MREYVMKSPDNDFCLDKGICIQYANLKAAKKHKKTKLTDGSIVQFSQSVMSKKRGKQQVQNNFALRSYDYGNPSNMSDKVSVMQIEQEIDSTLGKSNKKCP